MPHTADCIRNRSEVVSVFSSNLFIKLAFQTQTPKGRSAHGLSWHASFACAACCALEGCCCGETGIGSAGCRGIAVFLLSLVVMTTSSTRHKRFREFLKIKPLFFLTYVLLGFFSKTYAWLWKAPAHSTNTFITSYISYSTYIYVVHLWQYLHLCIASSDWFCQ